MPRTMARRIENAQSLLAEFTTRLDELGKRGIDQDTLSEGKTLYCKVKTLENQRNILKIRSQAIFAQMNQILKELERFCYTVQRELPMETWTEIPFRTKRYPLKRRKNW